MKRALLLGGVLALLTGLAFLVARPPVPDPATNPYSGKRGASLAKSSGIEIRYRRGDEVRDVDPATVLRAGDELRFKVRGEGPRYLEVRLKDGAAPPTTLFPDKDAPPESAPVAAGGGGQPAEPITVQTTTPQVWPGETLPITLPVAPGGGKLVVTALFSDRQRPLGVAPDADTETITAVFAKE